MSLINHPYLKDTGVYGQLWSCAPAYTSQVRGTSWRTGSPKKKSHGRANCFYVDLTDRKLWCRESPVQITGTRLRTWVESARVSSSKLLNPWASPEVWYKTKMWLLYTVCIEFYTQTHKYLQQENTVVDFIILVSFKHLALSPLKNRQCSVVQPAGNQHTGSWESLTKTDPDILFPLRKVHRCFLWNL